MGAKVHKRMKKSWDDRIFDFICNFLLIAFVLIVFYPVYYVVIAAISDPVYATTGKPLLYPKGVTFDGIKFMLEEKNLWRGYANTIYYTVCGTVLGVTLTVMCGYAFSRKDLPGRGILMKLYVITMYFGGGMIPTFLVVKGLGMLNTRSVMIVLGCISVSNIIMVRATMMSTIPDELLDAARIDGCGNGRFFVTIVVPLSRAIISVMVLYIAVSYWNSYMNAVIYLQDESMNPLQLELRKLLNVVSDITRDMEVDLSSQEGIQERMERVQLMKYSAIVVTALPVMCIYPFIQKYFVKGVMVGSIKG